MIEIMILNACFGFNVTANFARMDIKDAQIIDQASKTCRTRYKGCLQHVDIKEYDIGGKHYGVTCADDSKLWESLEF